MKAHTFSFLLIPLLLAAAGYTKYPLSLDQKELEPLSELLSDIRGQILIRQVLADADVLGKPLSQDGAVIVNDASQLKSVELAEQGVLEWPQP